MEKAFSDAGFKDIRIEKVVAPLRLPTASGYLQFEQESFGALHQMLGGLSDTEQDEAWDEIEQALRQFENGQQFEGPCEMLIAVSTR